jgi:hypothetical protein
VQPCNTSTTRAAAYSCPILITLPRSECFTLSTLAVRRSVAPLQACAGVLYSSLPHRRVCRRDERRDKRGSVDGYGDGRCCIEASVRGRCSRCGHARTAEELSYSLRSLAAISLPTRHGGGRTGCTRCTGRLHMRPLSRPYDGSIPSPSVSPYQTIQIACRLTGFQVADGNPWWYRIAQSPWSNTFYASADNSCNDSQTSGSLVGTPWVDTNIPRC